MYNWPMEIPLTITEVYNNMNVSALTSLSLKTNVGSFFSRVPNSKQFLNFIKFCERYIWFLLRIIINDTSDWCGIFPWPVQK